MLELFWLIRLIKLLNDYLEARTDVIRLILTHTKTVHFHVREGAINMGDGGYPPPTPPSPHGDIPPMIKNCQRVYCSFPYYSLILVLPFSTLTIVLHLKDRRQSNEQTNNTHNSYGSK